MNFGRSALELDLNITQRKLRQATIHFGLHPVGPKANWAWLHAVEQGSRQQGGWVVEQAVNLVSGGARRWGKGARASWTGGELILGQRRGRGSP
jgi:hypothetical protein